MKAISLFHLPENKVNLQLILVIRSTLIQQKEILRESCDVAFHIFIVRDDQADISSEKMEGSN